MAKLKEKPKFKTIGFLVACLAVSAGGIYIVFGSHAGSYCDSQPASRARIACYASTYVGNTQEGKTDYRINQWNQEFGCENGDPWCAWVGLDDSFQLRIVCGIAKMSQQIDPKPGDGFVILFRFPGRGSEPAQGRAHLVGCLMG
jgi:hypothetical protein